MRRAYRRVFWLGILLGVVVSLCLPTLAKEPYFTAQITERQSNWNEHLYVHMQAVPSHVDYYPAPIIYQDIVRSLSQKDDYCMARFNMSANRVKQLLRLSYAMIVSKLVNLKLSDDARRAIDADSAWYASFEKAIGRS